VTNLLTDSFNGAEARMATLAVANLLALDAILLCGEHEQEQGQEDGDTCGPLVPDEKFPILPIVIAVWDLMGGT
jgi:hypothetical protein